MRRLAVAVGLAALLAPACAAPPAANGPADEPRRIRVLMRTHLSGAPLLIAEHEGFFRDEGLEIERRSLASGRDALPPLIVGEADVLAGVLRTSYLSAIAQGAGVRIVADKGHLGRADCTYAGLLVAPNRLQDGRLVPPPEGRGRGWTVSGSRDGVASLLLQRGIARLGVDSDAVDVRVLGDQTEALALQRGRVDVVSSTGVALQRLIDSGVATLWQRGEELAPGFQYGVLLFGPSLLERDPEAGIRFMTAYLRGIRQYNQGKTERNLEAIEATTDYERGDLEAACWIPVREDGRIDVPSVAELVEWSRQEGLLESPLDARRFWAPRFVEEAGRRLAERSSEPPKGTVSRP